MICAFCKNEIEADSYFCDQCGKEINVCPQCGSPGKGKVCTEHGKKLITAKERNEQNGTPETKPEMEENTRIIPEEAPHLVAVNDNKSENTGAGQPVLTFVNNAINVNLSLMNGDIIGRRKGRFADKFVEYKQISGGHAKVEYDGSHWILTDLDSSNGTRYNGDQLKANTPRIIEDGGRVILANIEFIVKIVGESNDDKTIRL